MKISVILPCYNGATTIAQQLAALTSQAWRGGWELIVVNNGSTDGSMDVVSAYQGHLPSLQIVQAHTPGQPRLGVPHSYNSGIKQATGDAFVFCEADDEVAPGWLSAMGEALTRHHFVIARLDHRKLNPAWLHPVTGEGYQSAGLSKIAGPPDLPHGSGCSFGLRRSLYEHLGPLNTEYPCTHDTEYSWRAQLAGYRLHFEPDALIHYREKTGFGARFRQGRSWGRDFARLTRAYGAPRKRFALLRQSVWLARSLPRGARAWLLSLSAAPHARGLLAEWIWDLGWNVGTWIALQMPEPVSSHVDAPAGKPPDDPPADPSLTQA